MIFIGGKGMVQKKKAETYGRNSEWMLTKDKLYVEVEDKDGNTKWQFVSKFIKVLNVRQVAETNDTTLTLQYLYKGQYQTIDILRDQILQPNEFQKLSRKGIDVIHSNVKPMVQFLRVQEDSAPYETVHNHMGWADKEDQLYFKHHSIIGKNPPASIYSGDYNIEPKGTLQGWLDIIQSEVMGNHHLELALAFGFSAPVVGLLSKVKDMDTLIVHIYGNSTQGKTTAAQLAVSPFGRPSKNEKGLIKSWSATHNAIVALLRDNYGIPIVLDEASMNTMKDYTSLLYMFAENREKERMNKEGELRKQRSWSTTIISTAEHSLFEKTNENAGLRMRAFEFGNITWTSSAENSNNLKTGLLDNYGHAGIAFVQYLIKLGVEKVVERCERWKAYCEENLPQTDFLSRVSEKFGILLATAEMINESLNLSLDIESMMKILHEVEEESAAEREMADKSYEYVIERVMQHSKYFIIETQAFNGNECWGRINFRDDEVEVSIFPHKFKQLLKEGNYADPKVICKEWKENGYLKTESGKYTNRGKIPIDSQVRANSGLPTTPDSKGRDKVYTVMMNKELAENYGIRKIISEEELSRYQYTPKRKSKHTHN
ncbi:DUF927 domain-containing protein [Cytobacillus firmus]|uniref:DUF927 domain-containing protein n=1 Tax=Cytobacillus firmus TaxID=1399 RepID=UPI00146FEF94|nr:DUF927 domain-containing protein [Cytobacillus firmus]